MVERARSVYVSDRGFGYSVLVPVWWITNESPGYAWPTGNPNLPPLPKMLKRRYVTLRSADYSRRYRFPIFNPYSSFLPVQGDVVFLVGIDGVSRDWYVYGRVGERNLGRG